MDIDISKRSVQIKHRSQGVVVLLPQECPTTLIPTALNSFRHTLSPYSNLTKWAADRAANPLLLPTFLKSPYILMNTSGEINKNGLQNPVTYYALAIDKASTRV